MEDTMKVLELLEELEDIVRCRNQSSDDEQGNGGSGRCVQYYQRNPIGSPG